MLKYYHSLVALLAVFEQQPIVPVSTVSGEIWTPSLTCSLRYSLHLCWVLWNFSSQQPF